MAEKLFNVGIKGVIIKDDKVLILKNTKGFWEVPGGRIDGNETVEETLRRELDEELPNITSVVVHGVVGAGRIEKDIQKNVSLVLIFYAVSADFDGEPQLSHEHEDYKWATQEEALEVVYETCKEPIRNAFQGQQAK